jgi:bifunctional DNase/RNase
VASTRIPLTLTDVQLAVPASVGVEAGMVILTEQQPPGRMLRIIIGQPEARAIMAAWQGAVPGRPATWDLLLSTVELLGGRVQKVIIHAVEEERHFFAMIELAQAGERRVLSCRPSDGIALAVRAYGSEILAEEAVLDAAGVLADGSRPPPKETAPAAAGPDAPTVAPGQAQALGVPQAAPPPAEPPPPGEPPPAEAAPPPAEAEAAPPAEPPPAEAEAAPPPAASPPAQPDVGVAPHPAPAPTEAVRPGADSTSPEGAEVSPHGDRGLDSRPG